MSDVRFTPQQQQAINERNKNILVSAAAGSGKTAVLVERILSIITDPDLDVNIDNFLVVTFTRAAADEMREKINTAISKRLEKEPENTKLTNQLLLLNKAYITTIDSFCMSVVKQNFHQTQLDPDFSIHSDDEIGFLTNEVIEQLFEEKYKAKDEQFLYLVEYFCNGGEYGKNDKNKLDDFKLVNIVKEIYKNAFANTYPEKWLNNILAMYDIDAASDFYNTAWGNIIKTEVQKGLQSLEMTINNFIDIASKEENYCYYFVEKLIPYYRDNLPKLKNSFKEGMKSFVHTLNTLEAMPRKSSRKSDIITPECMNNLSALRTETINIINNLETLNVSTKVYVEEIKALKPVVFALIYLVKEFSDRLMAEKIKEQVFEYNDIAHITIDILIDGNGKPTDVAKNMQKQFYEIIVDEYQDNNHIQELILSAVSKESCGIYNRFMVGDIKQSIYKFRTANPEIFIEKYENYGNNTNSTLISLSKNFRSRDCILDFTNYIFKQVMCKSFGDLNYNEDVELKYGADYKKTELETSDKVELRLFKPLKNLNIAVSNMDNMQLDAEFVAYRINEIVNINKAPKVYDSDLQQYRDPQYKDIVILFRNDSKPTPVFLDVLAEYGIPASSPKSSNLFDTIEVKTLIAMLKIIDNPLQDIDLLTVLHCPAYNFTVNEITKIKGKTRENSFYNTIINYIDKNDDTLSQRLKLFTEDLSALQQQKNIIPVSQLIDKALSMTGYINYIQALSNGVKRNENMKILKEIALSMENKGRSGLFDYLEQLKDIVKFKKNMSEAISAVENNVRIMSIHASKGLEFPIVFMPQLEKNFKNSFGDIIIHSHYGIAPKFVDLNTRTHAETMPYITFKNMIIQENCSEELRLLYVGLTRAKEKLILSGTLKDDISKFTDFHSFNKTNFGAMYKNIPSKSFLKIILHALTRNKKISTALSSIQPYNNEEINNFDLKCDAKIINPISILEHKINTSITDIDLIKQLNNISESNSDAEIKTELDWIYPDCDIMDLASKISISEIKKASYTDNSSHQLYTETEFTMPEFLNTTDTQLSAASKGTAYHALMEFLDFNYTSEQEINELKQKLINSKHLSEKEANCIDNNKILKFLESPLNQKLRNSKAIYKEQPFIMGMTPFEIYKEEKYKKAVSSILVNGIIDLFFENENGDIILVDYKTDYVPGGNHKIIMDRYQIQIELYKKAIERSLNKKVVECYLYLFGIDKEVQYT